MFHLTLLIIFMFAGFSLPNPFPPKEIGLPVELALGNTDAGSGEVQPESTSEPEEVEPVPEPVETPPTDVPEPVETQDAEADMSVPDRQEETKPVEKKPELDPRLQRALNNPFQTSKDNPSDGQGETDQPGDFGKPNGSPDGNGLDGSNGGGLSASLGGRAAKNLRPIPGNWQEEGVIIISVIVDRYGKVISAKNARGTTVTNSALIKAAEAEALKVKFTPKSDAPEEQRGLIRYPIYLQ